MQQAIRFPLLVLLASLVLILVGTPEPVAADVTCDREGHFVHTEPLYGSANSPCGSGNSTYCRVGQQVTEYDCVPSPGGGYNPVNVISYSPTFCWCYTPYQQRTCCG